MLRKRKHVKASNNRSCHFINRSTAIIVPVSETEKLVPLKEEPTMTPKQEDLQCQINLQNDKEEMKIRGKKLHRVEAQMQTAKYNQNRQQKLRDRGKRKMGSLDEHTRKKISEAIGDSTGYSSKAETQL